MSGYRIEIDRRYGHHDGETEVEISTDIDPVISDRILRLRALEHPDLCAFVVREDGRCNNLCIRRHVDSRVLHMVVDYLTAWPGPPEDAAWLRLEQDREDFKEQLRRRVGLPIDYRPYDDQAAVGVVATMVTELALGPEDDEAARVARMLCEMVGGVHRVRRGSGEMAAVEGWHPAYPRNSCQTCGLIPCVCQIRQDHVPACGFRLAATNPGLARCGMHGSTPCDVCDPCTCPEKES